MMLHAQAGFRGTVLDLETGRPVPKVLWLDVERGQLEAYQLTGEGNIACDAQGNYLTYRAQGRFRFIPEKAPALAPPVHLKVGAERCSKCGNPLTLPGHELCAFCNALDKGVKGFKVAPLPTPLFDRPCQKPGCSRLADYAVSDEVEASPRVGPGTWRGRQRRFYYERGTTVARRFWCTFHYQPPRLLDPKGEVVEVLEEAGGVRPQ